MAKRRKLWLPIFPSVSTHRRSRQGSLRSLIMFLCVLFVCFFDYVCFFCFLFSSIDLFNYLDVPFLCRTRFARILSSHVSREPLLLSKIVSFIGTPTWVLCMQGKHPIAETDRFEEDYSAGVCFLLQIQFCGK